MKYMLAAPYLNGSEWAYVQECLQTNWISSKGRFIEEFEHCFAQFTHRKHGIATCNGTAALHIALDALGAGPGDEVIVPSLTYVASVNAIAYCGATPVFADSDPRTGCLAVDSVERLLSPRTRGIVAVHFYGHPCAMQPLQELANERGLWVLEDAAEAHGATYDGAPAGSFGQAAMFSFFGNKIVTTGEGGMVVTDDDKLAERLRLLRGQGMDPQQRYWHPILGYNYRMTNIQAAIGLGQMEHVDQLLYDRRRIADWYRERLVDVASLTLLDEVAPASSVFWLYSVLVDQAARRDPLMSDLAEAGIETRPFFHPAHRFPMYRSARTDNGCPVACDLAARGLNLPTSSYLGEADIDAIAGVLRELAGEPRRSRPQPAAVAQTKEYAWD